MKSMTQVTKAKAWDDAMSRQAWRLLTRFRPPITSPPAGPF